MPGRARRRAGGVHAGERSRGSGSPYRTLPCTPWRPLRIWSTRPSRLSSARSRHLTATCALWRRYGLPGRPLRTVCAGAAPEGRRSDGVRPGPRAPAGGAGRRRHDGGGPEPARRGGPRRRWAGSCPSTPGGSPSAIPNDAGTSRWPPRARPSPCAATSSPPGPTPSSSTSGSTAPSARCWPASCPCPSRRSAPGASTCSRPGSAAAWPAPLFASTGRHVGFLSLLAEDPARPSPADRQILAAVTRVIADDLDRTQEIATIARIVGTAEAGVVLTRGGDVLALPGLPDDRLLAPGSPILAAATDELSAGGPYTAFLAPAAGPDGERLVRVTALDCALPDLDHLRPRCCCPPPGTCAASPPSTSGSWGTWWPARRRSPRSPRLSTSTGHHDRGPPPGPGRPGRPRPHRRCHAGAAHRAAHPAGVEPSGIGRRAGTGETGEELAARLPRVTAAPIPAAPGW